jgi:diadenosine tetraphosphatase ApaH/serine/threonine PP2A family protein phosphatase
MRVAVLSDIHSNAQALEAVLASLGAVDQVWVLGDIVGYGGQPDVVVARLSGVGALAVQGNHDAAVLGRISTYTFNDLARQAVAWTAAAIVPETRGWLAGLPERRVEGDLTLVHGSPRDPLWEYLDSVPAARAALAAFETPHCLVGHTHVPAAFRDEAGHVTTLLVGDGTRLRLDERRCILNPGSVGQPRDGDPRACAMVIDTAEGHVEWHRVAYPISEAQAAIRGRGLPGPLADRLAVGR